MAKRRQEGRTAEPDKKKVYPAGEGAKVSSRSELLELDPWAPVAGRCNGNRTDGSGLCRQPVGWGTGTGRGRCKRHGGSTPNHVKKAQREELEEAVHVFNLSREIEPTDALLEELWRTAAMVSMLDREICSKTAEPPSPMMSS